MEIEVKKSNREHSFDVELASIVGLEKAILIKNISYWIEENKRRNETGSFANGIWWTEESLTSLAKKYPYFKRTSIGRWMQELHDLGWIRIVVGKSEKTDTVPEKCLNFGMMTWTGKAYCPKIGQ